MYHITNHLAVARNFQVTLADNGQVGDSKTWLNAAPIVKGENIGGIAVYISTNGDPVLLAIYSATNAYGHGATLAWLSDESSLREQAHDEYGISEDDAESDIDDYLLRAGLIR